MKFGPFDKVGIVVRDIDEAVSFFEKTFGWGPWQVEKVKSFAPFQYYQNECQSNCFVDSASFPVQGDTENAGRLPIELLHPISGYSSLMDYYEKHGPGIQHVQITVPDIDEAIAAAEEGGCVVSFRGTENLPMYGITIRVACMHNEKILGDTEIWFLEMKMPGMPG